MESVMDIPAPVAAVKESVFLRDKLAGVRSRLLTVSAGAGVAWMIILAVVALAAGMLVDWWMDLPFWARTLMLLADLAGLAALLFIFIIRPALRQPDDDTVALLVQKARPAFCTRLIAAMQLARPGGLTPGASAELVRALVKETEAMARRMDIREVIPTGPFQCQARNALILLALAATAFAYTREVSLPLLKRALLADVEVPRKTRVDVLSGDKLIGRGDNVTIIARARGYIPKSGLLLITHASGHSEEIPLIADRRDSRKFVQEIENVQDTFTYKVRLFDGVSPRYKVEAVPRPEVAFLECNQIYPAYTGLGTVRRSLGDLVLLAGSKLQLKATATKEISKASVKLVGLGKVIAMEVSPQNRKQMAATVPVPIKDLSGISLNLTDRHGVQSRDPAVYRVDILLDKPPVTRITYPDRKEDLVTQMAALLIGFEAMDDFAIGKVFLRYKIDTVDKGAEKSIELDLGKETPKSLRRRFEWQLRDLPAVPAEGSIIEYWMEAADTNNETGPGTGASEHYVARVVSEAEKRADLMNRVNDYLGGITEVAKDQERLNEVLGTIIRAKPQ
jgi:hypothetical protein